MLFSGPLHVWRDTSSRSRGEVNTTPNEYTYNTKSLRISLHRHIDYDKDVWLVTCHSVGLERRHLKQKDALKAQVEAIKVV